MNVAVTGSHGFIGSVLCRVLTEAGHDVYACDNKKFLGPDFRYFKTVVNCSFDDDYYIDMIHRHDIHIIYHLAATSTVGPDATDPWLYYSNNPARTTNLIKKLADRGWKGHIVFSSTAAVYGDKDYPVRETNSTEPTNNYGFSKLMCEHILREGHKYGINVTILRYFNVAGAYDDLGEEVEDTHLLSRICTAACDGTDVTVFGTDYSTDDGTCVRDYIHVRDVCRAQLHAVDKKLYGTYNLGTNRGASVGEMINVFETYTGVNIQHKTGPRREGDPPFLVANGQKFVDTGFEYKHSSLQEIVTSQWEHFKHRSSDGV